MHKGVSVSVWLVFSLLTGCVTPERGPVGPRVISSPKAISHLNGAVVTIIAEPKYYLSDAPPRLVWAEIYGDEAAIGISGNTNLEGVVFEVVSPPEYAGRVYTLRSRSGKADRVFEWRTLYELRVARADIGKFTFPGNADVRARKLSPSETQTVKQARTGPVIDDLEWLVGRWRCNIREWLVPWNNGTLGSHCEDNLEYFNVYFPYADDRLTLELHDRPSRNIAAEFLARVPLADFWSGKNAFREYLTPMEPPGPVTIGKRHICVGGFPFSYEFEYSWREGRLGIRILELRSSMMRLELYKLTDYPGDIQASRVSAPIRDYTPEQIADLKAQYDSMKRAHQQTKNKAPGTD